MSVLCCAVSCVARVWHDSFSCDVTQSCMHYDALKLCVLCCVRRPVLHVRDMTHLCVTWLIYVWCDSIMCAPRRFEAMRVVLRGVLCCTCVTWLIYVWHDSFIYHVTQLCMRHDASKLRVLCCAASCVTYARHDTFMRDVTQSCMRHDASKSCALCCAASCFSCAK